MMMLSYRRNTSRNLGLCRKPDNAAFDLFQWYSRNYQKASSGRQCSCAFVAVWFQSNGEGPVRLEDGNRVLSPS